MIRRAGRYDSSAMPINALTSTNTSVNRVKSLGFHRLFGTGYAMLRRISGGSSCF
jgi:hypothetical protein